jgi:6-phosphogluconolactonase
VLTATTPVMVPTGFFPQGIAASANFVYTANSDDNSVSMFTINTNSGILTPLTPAETLVPPLFASRSSFSSPDFVTVDPSGRFVYVSDQGNGSISTFTINPSTGALVPTTPSGVIAGPDPFGVAVDPSSKFAYVPDETLNAIYMYTVDATTGALTSNPATYVPAGNQPSWVAIDPATRFAYAVNRIDNTVSMYTIDASNGTLTPNAPATVATGNAPFSIVVNSAGTFAYVTNQGGGVSIYKIQSDGILSPTGTAKTGINPIVIALTH